MDEKKPSEIGEEIMSLKGHGPVRPGPCSPKGCPPPKEIVCIKTKKVYQECKQVEPIERVRVYDLYVPPGACAVECIRVSPGVISCEDVSGCPGKEPQPPAPPAPEMVVEEERGVKKKPRKCGCEVGEGTVTLGEILNFPVQITVEFFDRNGLSMGCQTGWGKINIPEKTVLLSRAGEPQLRCEVDAFLSCLMCYIEELEPNGLSNTTNERQGPPRWVICCINKILVFKLLAVVQLMIPSYGFCPEPPDCEQEVEGCPDPLEEWPPYPNNEGGGGCRGCR